MNIDYTGRHIEITPALREFTEEKLSKLEKLLDGPLDVHVVLVIEKHRHVAEIQVKSRTAVLSGTQETGDLYASIGEVADKLERQALRHKEKLQSHKHRKSQRDPDVAAELEAQASASAPGGEPAPQVPSADAAGEPRIVRGANYRVKPLAAEDAVLEMEASGQDLLVFRDSDSDRVCVLFRQRNGDLQLVEPEF
jgi:putative sigma-54 modulation protein